MHIGCDQIWLDEVKKLKGLAEFHTDLSDINILNSFEVAEPKKKAEKIQVHVRRKDNAGGLF